MADKTFCNVVRVRFSCDFIDYLFRLDICFLVILRAPPPSAYDRAKRQLFARWYSFFVVGKSRCSGDGRAMNSR